MTRPCKWLTLAAASALIVACGTNPVTPPERIQSLPVHPLGSGEAPAGDYILRLPAGQPLPVAVSLDGAMFTQPGQATLYVTPGSDLMLYRDWVSRDGRGWRRLGEEFGVEMTFGVDERSAKLGLRVVEQGKRDD
ncbi:MAG: hypothetical protein ACPGU7_14790 [Gammaproteobacteria bacterium]